MVDVNKTVQAAIEKAAQQTNMNEAQKGVGGDYVPPAEGLARLRFVAYIELGKHFDEKWNKTKERVQLVFELSGAKHEPHKTEDGNLIPHRITVNENLSLNEKANFYKLFKKMNYDGTATHIAQLLGKEFLGTVVHNKSKDGKRVYANLRDDSGYTIKSPYYEDPMSGETHHVPAGPQISETRCFLWDYADLEMWNSIYIEGEYEEEKNDKGEVVRPAKSKNVFQNTIKEASNFPGSPVAELLEADALNISEEEAAGQEGTSEGADEAQSDPAAHAEESKEDAAQSKDDPLAGIV